jgi:hypothetical protein
VHDDELSRAQAEGDQVARQAVGAAVELAIGPGAAVEGEGRRIGALARHRFEQPMDRRLARVVGLGGVPLHYPRPLGAGQELDLVHARIGVGRDRLEERAEVPEQVVDRAGVEQARVELREPVEASVRLLDREREVELRHAIVDVPCLGPQPREGPRRSRHVLVGEHHAHERRRVRAARKIQRLHQHLERQVLVRECLQRLGLHAPEKRAKRRVTRNRHSQRQRVGEQAHHRLQLDTVAIGHGRADDHLVLSRVAVEHRLESREKDHVGRRVHARAERIERAGELRRKHERGARAGPRQRLAARAIRRQAHVRPRRGHARDPAIEQRADLLVGEPAALPGGEVGVLELRLRNR